jgi:hypothetical protein
LGLIKEAINGGEFEDLCGLFTYDFEDLFSSFTHDFEDL